MPEEIFSYVIELEEELIELFNKAVKLSRHADHTHIFHKVKKQSVTQVGTLQRLVSQYTRPRFNRQMIEEVQDDILSSLWDTIINEPDVIRVKKNIASAKLKTADLYHAIALYFNRLSQFYQQVSQVVEQLSAEERGDSKQILQ